jgi:site-specific DNA-methyltransferase (adenine-specific)
MTSEVFNTDCLEYMRTLPDKAFALAIADPPYGINAANMSNTKSMRNRLQQGAGKLKDRILQCAKKDWDFYPPKQEFFDELFRVCKNVIIWGGNYFNLPPTRCIICWDKVQPWENFSQVEIAWTSFDYPAKLYKFDNRTNDKIHPTQKPVDLYAWCLRTFAKVGDRIFDPMMGSQSSRIAAYKMGFDYVGCELDKEYFDKGCERFNRECKGEIKTKDGHIIKQTTLW